jgi:hypothetical protein
VANLVHDDGHDEYGDEKQYFHMYVVSYPA